MAEDKQTQASVIDLLDDAIVKNELKTGISKQFISQFESAIMIYKNEGAKVAFEFMCGCAYYSFCDKDPLNVPSFPIAARYSFIGTKRNIDASKEISEKNSKNGSKGGSRKGECHNPNGRRGNKAEQSETKRNKAEQSETKPNIEIEEIRNNEEEIRSKNKLEEYYYSSLSSDKDFLESVAAKYPVLKADGVRAMLTQFLEWCKADNKSHKSLNDFQDHFTNWLFKGKPMTREQTQRNLDAKAESERQAAEREKQYDEAAKNAMPHDVAMNDPRYIETMAMLEAEG